MDESLPETRTAAKEEVLAICTLLEEHKGGDVIALDLKEIHNWTDYFIIVTVTSNAHLKGMLRHINDYAKSQQLQLFGGHRKNDDGGGWNLVDMGTAVIHLMTAQTREFFKLEELWSSAGIIYPITPGSTPI